MVTAYNEKNYAKESVRCYRPFNIAANYYCPQRSCEGYVFTCVCDSVHRGGAIPACLAAGLQGGCLVLGVPGPGGVWCGLLLWPSGLVAFWLKVAFWYGLRGGRRPPHQKAITEDHFQTEGCLQSEGHNRRPQQKAMRSPSPPPSRRLLLRTVRILLECILVLI